MLKTKFSFREYFEEFKFPNISRLINEELKFILFKKKILKNLTAYVNIITFVTVFFIVILFTISTIVGFNIYNNLKIRRQILGEKQKVLSDIVYWENVITKYSNYRDGYFNLALLYYRLKDFQKSKENLDEVFRLDPNFKEGRELEKLF